MTRIKLCGLTRLCDIERANALMPDYVGFVFAPKSKRYIAPMSAKALHAKLDPNIRAVGVFVNETAEIVASLLSDGVIEAAQLHGSEDADYIKTLRRLTKSPLIQAFRVDTPADLIRASASMADYILLDNGAGGTGAAFDWSVLKDLERRYFLAGGLNPQNVAQAIETLHPFAVDVSSGIETDGVKDHKKMTAFVNAARNADQEE